MPEQEMFTDAVMSTALASNMSTWPKATSVIVALQERAASAYPSIALWRSASQRMPARASRSERSQAGSAIDCRLGGNGWSEGEFRPAGAATVERDDDDVLCLEASNVGLAVVADDEGTAALEFARGAWRQDAACRIMEGHDRRVAATGDAEVDHPSSMPCRHGHYFGPVGGGVDRQVVRLDGDLVVLI